MDRIVNGTEAKANEFPWIANFGFCGGVVIDRCTILTAAHCDVRPGNLVRLGDLSKTEFETGEVSEKLEIFLLKLFQKR